VKKINKMRSNTMIDKKTNTKNKNTLTRGYGERKKNLRKGEKKGEDDLYICGPVWKFKENN
jgi:hypothetical protein